MAECLEDYNLDFDFNFNNMNHIYAKKTNNTSVLQMIDMAEKEGFKDLELSNIDFLDGIIFNRVQRLDKVEKIIVYNTNITSLANFPLNIRDLLIKKGEIQIANFKLLSDRVEGVSIIDNKIHQILYLNELKNLVYIDLSKNNLEEIPILPINVMTFIATHNKIKQIKNLNEKLIEVNLSDNLITYFNMIPNSIESINISRNQIKIADLSSFKNLKVFKAYNNKIDLIIGPISPCIEVFDVFNNELQQIPDIGSNIKDIDLSKNDLKILPKFGTGLLERFDITDNPLLNLSDDDIFMLMEINKLNKSLVVLCDQIDLSHHMKDLNFSPPSSEHDSSDIIFHNSDDNDIKTTNETQNMKYFDIIELLNRNKHNYNYNYNYNPQSFNNQQMIILGKQIYKRRTYEM
jgi:hypothetical protein